MDADYSLKTYKTTIKKRLSNGTVACYTVNRKYKVKNPKPCLTNEQIVEARRLVADGVAFTKVSRKFNISTYKLKKILG